jgi:NAD/NADP transhydrogenase beta subunit
LLVSAGILLGCVIAFAAGVSEYVGVVASLVVGAGAGAILAMWLRNEPLPQASLLLGALGAAAALLVAGAELHHARMQHSNVAALRDAQFAGVKIAVRRAEEEKLPPILFGLPGTAVLAIAVAGIAGGATVVAGGMAYLKRTQKELVKGFLRPERPELFVAGLGAAVLLLAALLLKWPHRESLYWVMVVVTGGLGYVVAMVLKRRDITLVSPLVNCGCGLAGAAAGLAIGNALVIVAGGIVAGANAAIARQAYGELKAANQSTVEKEPEAAVAPAAVALPPESPPPEPPPTSIPLA